MKIAEDLYFGVFFLSTQEKFEKVKITKFLLFSNLCINNTQKHSSGDLHTSICVDLDHLGTLK